MTPADMSKLVKISGTIKKRLKSNVLKGKERGERCQMTEWSLPEDERLIILIGIVDQKL